MLEFESLDQKRLLAADCLCNDAVSLKEVVLRKFLQRRVPINEGVFIESENALQRIPKNSARQEFGQHQDDCVLRPGAILVLVNEEAGVAAAYDLLHASVSRIDRAAG
jgi:hypothetical protein